MMSGGGDHSQIIPGIPRSGPGAATRMASWGWAITGAASHGWDPASSILEMKNVGIPGEFLGYQEIMLGISRFL